MKRDQPDVTFNIGIAEFKQGLAWNIIDGDGQPVAFVGGSVLAGEQAERDPVIDNVFDGRSRSRQFGRQTEETGVIAIADNEPTLGIEHAQGLRHVVERGVEPGDLNPARRARAPEQMKRAQTSRAESNASEPKKRPVEFER